MKILIACEYSGRTREAFAKLGHDVMSCDFYPTEQPGNHYQGDVRDIIGDKWDMIIAHPDCTFITNAGVRWLDTDISRWKFMYEGCEFFKLFLHHPCPKIAIENPIPHKYALGWIGKKYDQLVQPWMFGHTESKATCLWLKGLPKLDQTNNVKEIMDKMPKKETQKVHYASPGPDRWKDRSRTYQGISDAMAQQWGCQ